MSTNQRCKVNPEKLCKKLLYIRTWVLVGLGCMAHTYIVGLAVNRTGRTAGRTGANRSRAWLSEGVWSLHLSETGNQERTLHTHPGPELILLR